jgi:hypothetical protein
MNLIELLNVWLCTAVVSVCVAICPSRDFAFEMEPMISKVPNNAAQLAAEISNIFLSASRRVAPDPDGTFGMNEVVLSLCLPGFYYYCRRHPRM